MKKMILPCITHIFLCRQNGGAKNETAVMAGSNPGGPDRDFAACQAALGEAICPGEKGASFRCMACADAHRAEVVAACGNFTDANDYHGIGGGWVQAVVVIVVQ